MIAAGPLLVPDGLPVVAAQLGGAGFGGGAQAAQAGVPGGDADLAELVPDVLGRPGGHDRAPAPPRARAPAAHRRHHAPGPVDGTLEAILIITIGLGIGLAIAATALLPLSHALMGGLRPYAPADWLAAILGVSALLALVALSVPTRRALRTQPVEAIGIRE